MGRRRLRSGAAGWGVGWSTRTSCPVGSTLASYSKCRGRRHHGSVVDERVELVVGELGAAVQEVELDQARDPAHVATAALDEGGGRAGRPARGEDVVDDQDALALVDRVAMELEGGRAVLEVVLLRRG